MPTDPQRKPTEAELALLQHLWKAGPSTVRQVHDAVEAATKPRKVVAYTTVLKLLQIMTDKGFVRREALGRQHVYRPARSAEQTQRQLVKDLLQRAFDNSAATLVLQALSVRHASKQELAEVRQLLERLEQDAADAPA